MIESLKNSPGVVSAARQWAIDILAVLAAIGVLLLLLGLSLAWTLRDF